MKAEDRVGLKTLRLFRLWLFSALSAIVLQAGGNCRSGDSTALLRRRCAGSAAAKEQVKKAAQLLVRGNSQTLSFDWDYEIRDKVCMTRARHGQKQIEIHKRQEIENLIIGSSTHPILHEAIEKKKVREKNPLPEGLIDLKSV